MGFIKVVLKIMTAAGALIGTTDMGMVDENKNVKKAALKLAMGKGSQLEDETLNAICRNETAYHHTRENGQHVITCTLPHYVEINGGKLRFKSKRSRKSLKRMRKSKRKSLKKKKTKRKTSKRKYKR